MIIVLDLEQKTVELFTVKSLAAAFIECNRKTVERNLVTGKPIKGRFKVLEREVNKMKAHGRTGFK